MFSITTIYLVTTSLLFALTLRDQVSKADNYFAGILAYLADQNCLFILYNMLVSMAVVGYKVCVAIFFGETKEG